MKLESSGENFILAMLISSKPENKTGEFHTIALSNVFYKLRDLEKENNGINTKIKTEESMIQIIIENA